MTALHYAAKNGCRQVLDELLAAGCDQVNQVTEPSGFTALHLASQQGNVELVTALCQNDADVNFLNQRKDSALAYAASSGHLEVVKFLCKHGAEVNRGNRKGETPLKLAATNGHVAVVKVLCEQGADMSQVDEDEMTPFLCAAVLLKWAPRSGQASL